MLSKSGFWFLLSGLTALALLVAGCAPAATPAPTAPPEATEAAPTEVPPTVTPEEVGPRYGGILRLGTASDWGTLDPSQSWNMPMFQVLNMIGNSLTGIDQDGNIAPEAAEEITVSEDGLVYTFKLYEMKFHNGREVTADDWVYTFTRHLDPEVGSYYGFLLDRVKGAAEYWVGEADSVEGLQALDDHTLQITLVTPDNMLLGGLNFPNLCVLPKEEIEADLEAFARHPILTGPFMVKEYVPEISLTLVKTPDYWEEGLPYLDGVEITFGLTIPLAELKIEKGELDWSMDISTFGNVPPADLERVLSDPALEDYLLIGEPMDLALFLINGSQPVLDNVKVRKAMAYALDYERLASLAHGEPANYIWNPTKRWVYEPDYPGYTYDPGKAKELLEEAGYPNGEGLPEDWYIIVNETPPWPQMGEVIQKNLKDIGIDVDIRLVTLAVEADAWADPTICIMLTHNVDSNPDPSEMASFMTCEQAEFGYNVPRICDPERDEWIAAARASPDIEEQKALYKKIGHSLMEEAAWLPVWYPKSYLIHSPKIGNFHIPPGMTNLYDIRDWYLMP